MKLLVIPDIHENLEFLNYVLAAENPADFDKVVMLGDYFDPHPPEETSENRLRAVAKTLKGLSETLGDKLILLCGNHDIPYYALRPACGGGDGRPNTVIGGWLPDTSPERAAVINAVWDGAFWRRLEGAVLLDGWLFSHAGVLPRFWPADAGSPEAAAATFRERWREAFDRIFKESENPLFAPGRARGGTAEVGGPIWLDWDREFEDALEVPQIAGHTRCARAAQKGRSFCIDLAQGAYAVVEDGELNLRVWPESWLGEALAEKG